MARKPFPRPGRRAGTDARSGCGAAARSGRRSDLRRRQRAELSDRPDNQEHMTALSFKDLLAAIEGRSADFRDAASRSDPAARVPGCPDWSLADLVAHLGEVQRFWATVVMAGPSPTPPADDLVIGREPQGDLLAWSAAGTDAPRAGRRRAGGAAASRCRARQRQRHRPGAVWPAAGGDPGHHREPATDRA